MSRVRSQLDALLEQPHPAEGGRGGHRDTSVDTVQKKLDAAWARKSAGNTGSRAGAHADAGPRREPPSDLARIRDSLDRLAGRLGSMGASEPQASPTPRQRPPAQKPPEQRQLRQRQPSDYREPLGRAGADDGIGRELRAELAALRNDFADAFEQFESNSGRFGLDERTRDELYRLVDAVSRLEQQSRQAPDHLEDVSIELRNLHAALETVAASASPDLEGFSRSIETSYAELAGRMEEMISSLMDQISRSRDGGELRGELTLLGEHVVAIRDAIDRLPGHLSAAVPAEQIESRLDQLAGSIEALSDTEDRSLARHFGEIDARLDEITRALVAVSAAPGDNDAFERIEARIATLGKTVEQIAEEWQDSAALPASGADGFAAEIKNSLEMIDRRLSEIGKAPAADSREFDAIVDRLATLSDKLDNMSGFNAVAASMSGDNELLSRLDAIVGRLDALGEGGAPVAGDSAALAAIERQIAELADRIDAAPAAGLREGSSEDGEILAMLQSLAARIDTLAEARTIELPETEQLAALEQQLGGIVSQLDTLSAGGFDLAPISERLESIEQQVANSRDIAIDVASQAAERAVGMASGGGSFDPELIESLRTELHELNSNSRDSSERSVAAFDAVHEALSAIVDRLGAIDERLHGAPEAETSRRDTESNRPDPVEMPILREASYDDDREPMRDEDDGFEPRGESRDERAEYEDDLDERFEEVDRRQEDEAPLPQLDEAPSLETDEPVDELDQDDVEDVPLEPGSGAPDLAALVRQAAAKRKSGEASASSTHGAADLISAARRAAQAAAAEEAAAKEPAVEAVKKKPRRALQMPGLKGVKPVRLLLIASAIAAIAVFAVPQVMKFMGGSGEITAAPPAVQEGDPQAGTGQQGAVDGAQPMSNDAPTERPAADPASTTNGIVSPVTNATERQATVIPVAPADPVVSPVAAETVERTVDIPAPPKDVGNIALRQAAESGDGAALFEVGRRYTDGDPVDRDLTTAAQWYEYSARAGFAPAQYRLGNFFEKGHGVGSDVGKAVMWYQRAAEQGNALAMHNLAVLYTSGLVGGTPDMEAAVEWFRQAADLGVKDSQVNLGILYTRGMGVKEDLVEAYKWFAVAARAGDADAASKRDMLANAMRPDQLEQARGQAGLWKPASIDTDANTVVVKPEWTETGGRRAEAGSGSDNATQLASTGELVARVQTMLSSLGFDVGPSDGVMGQKTRDAIRAFQSSAGMKVDGEISGELIEALEKGAA